MISQKICRDVWVLNLSLLPNPPVAEPLLYLGEREEIVQPSTSTSTQEQEKRRAGAGESDAEQSDGERSDNGRSPSAPTDSESSLSSSDTEDSDRDSELEDLMRENSESPSSDEEEGNSRKYRTSVPLSKKKKATFGRHDAPATTVAVLAVACWTLRIPVMYMDFVRYAERFKPPVLTSLTAKKADKGLRSTLLGCITACSREHDKTSSQADCVGTISTRKYHSERRITMIESSHRSMRHPL